MISPINRDVVLKCIHQFKIQVFSLKTLFKILSFRKLASTFCSLHKFQSSSEEFWEPTYKSHCSRSHTVLRLIRYFVITQRERLYKSVFGLKRSCTRVEEKLYKVFCLLGCKKSCIHLAKEICQVVYKVLILGVQNQKLKENLTWVAWGLDVGQEDRTRINLLCLHFLSFLRFISLLASSYI